MWPCTYRCVWTCTYRCVCADIFYFIFYFLFVLAFFCHCIVMRYCNGIVHYVLCSTHPLKHCIHMCNVLRRHVLEAVICLQTAFVRDLAWVPNQIKIHKHQNCKMTSANSWDLNRRRQSSHPCHDERFLHFFKLPLSFNSTSYCLLIVDVNSGKPTLGDLYSLYHTAIQGEVIYSSPRPVTIY